MKYIYNSPIPEAAQTNERDQLGQQLAEAGILEEDGAIVESLSSEAADLTLSGQYRWGKEISTMLATELDELADSSLPTLPLYRRGGGYSNAGYYEIASADVEPLHGNDRSVWAYTLSLTSVGKKGSYFRAIGTNPRQLEHEFGNGLEAVVGVPAAASKVQWFNADGDRARIPASPIETRTSAAADVDIYDLTDAPWYDPPPYDEDPPTLIYTVDYADEVSCGTRVYDTQGHESKFSGGGSGPRQWQTVHSTEHDVEDPVIMSNALLRLRLEEAVGTITPQRWDASAGRWSTDALGDAGGWSLFDIDLLEIAMARDKTQLTFAHDSEGLFALNATLDRGREAVLFERPENEPGPIPDGLEDWLEPIAATTIVAPQATKGLVSRNEVRR